MLIQRLLEDFTYDDAFHFRRVYQNLSYFLFFYYILVGFFRCVYRVGVSSALVLFHIARLDKPLVFPGFERFDIGTYYI